MNENFPRILILLRKEKGLSQRQAASDLGISQALLSHYEKGIRECGLDFVVRASKYYDVSCDYLLGRSPHRTGAVLSLETTTADIPDCLRKSNPNDPEYQRRVIINSLNIVFAMLKKINTESLSRETSLYISSAVYKIFRILYSANPKNPQDMFELDRRLYGAVVESVLAMTEAKSRYILNGESMDGSPAVELDELTVISPDVIVDLYPQYAPALFDLIKNVETSARTER